MAGGRFRLEEPIGAGASAGVWRAHDERLGRPVAVKRLLRHLTADPVAAARFEREARAAARLSHPGIVPVFDAGVDDDGPWIAMELVDGESLDARIRRSGRLSPDQAVDIARQLAAALDHAHRHGLVHRDVKPGNVMLRLDGRAQLIDFGISRVPGTDATLTMTGTVVGTASYMAPEVAGGGRATPASDVYGLGVVLYEMLTGSPPFVRSSATATLRAHQLEPPDPPSARAPVSPALDRVVMRCLAKRPEDRYRSASEVLAALDQRVLDTATLGVGSSDAPTVSMPTAPAAAPPAAEHPAGRRRWGWMAALLTAGALVAWMLAPTGDPESSVPSTVAATTIPTTVAAPPSTSPSTTPPQPTTTVEATTVASSPVLEAAEGVVALVEAEPPRGVRGRPGEDIIESVSESVTAWLEGDLEGAAERLQDAIDLTAEIRPPELRVELTDALVVLAEAMGFEVQFEEDGDE